MTPARRSLVRSSLLLLAAVAALAPAASCNKIKPLSPDTLVNAAAETPSDDDLRRQLDEALDYTFNERRLNSKDQAAWQIVHGIMAFGPNFPIEHEGKDVKALAFLLEGGKIRGWDFEPGETLADGSQGLRAVLQQGSKEGQGHPDQWLGYLSMCGIPLSQTIKVDDKTYTLGGYIEQAMRDASRNPNGEYTWTIMALSEYFPNDLTWKAADGKEFSLEKLVQHEADQDIATSACGGTHRLTAMALARNNFLKKGGQLSGGWKAADDKIKACIEQAHKYQNPNGSFSSNYIERPGSVPDVALTLNTSGHVFEFLATALTDEQLAEPWMKQAAAKHCELIRKTKGMNLECGGLYHAAHGMIVYRERRFGKRSFPAETTAVNGKVAGK